MLCEIFNGRYLSVLSLLTSAESILLLTRKRSPYTRRDCFTSGLWKLHNDRAVWRFLLVLVIEFHSPNIVLLEKCSTIGVIWPRRSAKLPRSSLYRRLVTCMRQSELRIGREGAKTLNVLQHELASRFVYDFDKLTLVGHFERRRHFYMVE